MSKKTVTILVTRNYYKTASIEVEVDENLKDEELQNYLTESSEIDDEIEDALYAGSLQVADTEYLYEDPHNNDGGHL
mgnify:CR=1 FL=1